MKRNSVNSEKPETSIFKSSSNNFNFAKRDFENFFQNEKTQRNKKNKRQL